jgi:ubiquinone/menaquinone biosynthesis C-methylase UbiE
MTSTTFSGSSDAYERFMGRYSRPLARSFADFAGVRAGMRVLDVGAGTGALTDELIARAGIENVAALEPSPDYSAALRERLPGLDVRQASAEELPWADASFDGVLSQLVVLFLKDAPVATREQLRVLRDGGFAAACMWELDGLEVFKALSELRRRMDPNAPTPDTNYRSEQSLRELFESAGFRDVETTVLESAVEYASVDEIWDAAIHVGGPGGAMADALSPEQLAQGRTGLAELLGNPSDSFTLRGRAAAVRGVR